METRGRSGREKGRREVKTDEGEREKREKRGKRREGEEINKDDLRGGLRGLSMIEMNKD